MVLGAGFGNDEVKAMRDACSAEGCKKVPWLRPDLSKPTPPVGPEYGYHMAGRVESCLAELERERKMGVDGVAFC